MKGGIVNGEFSGLDHLELGAFDVLPVPCFLVDRSGVFAAANSAFYALTRSCRDDFFEKDPYAVIVPDDREKHHALDDKLLSTGDTISTGAVITAVNGDVAGSAVLKKTLIRDRDGEIAGVLQTVLECSELEAVRSVFKKTSIGKKPVLDGFPGIFCLLDENNRAVWVSDKVFDIHEDPLGKSCHEIFGGNKEECEICRISENLTCECATQRIVKFEKFDSKGIELIYEITATPVENSRGEVISILIVGLDITEKIHLERQLRHSQKMEAIGTLAGGIAHDFNNVLTPIMGYSEIIRLKMQQDNMEDQTILDYIDRILRAGRRAKNLVEQVLTFSRPSENKQHLQYMHPIVKEVMKILHVSLPATVVIQERIDENCGMVSVDPVQIHQILINLCTNSSDAMKGSQGTLTVTLAPGEIDREGQEWIRVSVADTGCGIEKEKLERIFDPYFTTKEKSRGTGMGLAMVHGIIKRQGGRIDVEIEVGVGTTFNLYLPVAKPVTGFDQVVNTKDLVSGNGTILLVDDEAQVVQVTGELLTSLGYQVTGRTSPFDALALFLKNPSAYDLLLTDFTMPELTGLELCKKVKAVRSDLPVVLFTGYSEHLPRKVADEAGVDHYCLKPVSMRELSSVVYNTLEKSL